MTAEARVSVEKDECREFGRVLAPFLDGELQSEALVDAEAHVATCENCRERVQLGQALRGTMKKVVRVQAPDALRARLATAMVAERARSDAREREVAKSRWLSSWRSMVPLAGAAAVGLAFFAAKGHLASRQSAFNHAGLGDTLLDELVAEHARPLPPEQTDPTKVRALAQYVGVPVQPIRFLKSGARLVGGRVLPVHTERAAMLQYEIGNGGDMRRVSVFIYDPRRIQVNGDDLSLHAVGTANVRVGRTQGYSVAVTQADGVGYAVASDLEEDKSAQLAALLDSQE